LLALFLLQKIDVLPSWKKWFSRKPLAIENTAIIVTEIKNIAELTTTQVYAEIVVDTFRTNKLTMANEALRSAGMLSIPFLEADRMVLIVKGKVQAGVDLKKLDSSGIYTKDDSVRVRLPKATILNVITNPSDFETFIEEGDWSDPAVQALKTSARQKLVAKAVALQILPKADERAKQVITQLLQTMGFTKIKLEGRQAVRKLF